MHREGSRNLRQEGFAHRTAAGLEGGRRRQARQEETSCEEATISGPGPESEAAAVDMETEEETQGEEEWEGEDTTDDEEGEGEDTTNDEGEDDPDAAALMAEAIDHMWM